MKIWNTIEDVLADFEADRPKPPPPKPTAAVKGQERFAASNKPTDAIAQDVALSSDALAQRLRDERQAERDRAHAQYNLDRAIEAMKGLQQEIVRLPYYQRSFTVGPRDSDAHLHVSAEDQLWGKV
jgi:hypothetical protein